MGWAEQAVRASISVGQRIPTPSHRATFVVRAIDRDSVTLLFGGKETPTRIPFTVFEAVVDTLSTGEWTLVGAVHSVESREGTVEAVVKPAIRRSAGNYVAALLDRAGVVDIALNPMRVRLRDGR